MKDVDLTASKCIIFLITCKFKVRWLEIITAPERYLVEDETTI